ncbi:MAG: hypothetical protein M3Q07_03445 [Pseudobdellovibrionaceae bacterium]|nr:hypothetical protein [Pseudobdellovibrionaceae bacterium]
MKTMAFPLIGVAVIQFVVGGSVYTRTDRQVKNLIHQAEYSPDSFKRDETNRMTAVMKNFKIYKTIEILLLVVGIILIVFFHRFDWAAGLGAGLVLQSAFMLCMDIFAETRGQDYLRSLMAFRG